MQIVRQCLRRIRWPVLVNLVVMSHTARMKGKGPPNTSARFGQFRISSIMSWTAVICAVLATFGLDVVWRGHGVSVDEILVSTMWMCLFFLPATLCIPFLVDQFLQPRLKNPRGIGFPDFWMVWLSILVGVYSILMLLLATNSFNAEWKGHKGLHWSYYMLEGYPGMTLWPSYAVGSVVFIVSIYNRKVAKQSFSVVVIMAIQVVISFWYAYACLALNFAENKFWIVPGSCGICYLIYAGILLKQREWSFANAGKQWAAVVAAISAFVCAVIAKYPLAKSYYDQLPDEAPDNCFIVTAATRGHRRVVHTWFDDSRDRIVNQQLLNFWAFENLLRVRFPNFHLWLRRIYNFVGPAVARCIVFKWQADAVYWLLKPLEFVANILRNR